MMNGVNSPGPYFPFHRDETYPRTLCVNFKRLEYRTLQRYCKLHGINVRPDCTQPELAVAAARHFQEAPAVDEEGVVTAFLKRVVDPERPFRPSIDLAAAVPAASSTLGKPSGASGRGVERVGGGRSTVGAGGIADGGVMGGDVDRDSCSNNEDEGNHNYGYDDDDDCEDGDYDNVGQHQHPRQHPRQHLRHQQQHEGVYHRGMDRDGREYRYGHRGGPGGRVPGRGGNVGFDEKSRMEGYVGRGMGGGRRDGGGYEEDMEYGRQPHQHHHRKPSWEGDGHQGGDGMPKPQSGGSRRSGGNRGRFYRRSDSAPAHGGSSAMTGRDGGMSGNGNGNGGGVSGGGGEDGRSRKQKGGGIGGDRAGGGGDAMVKPPTAKRKKGGGGWRAKNDEQVAVRDDREEPGTWILARVIKYVTETHHYELKDDDDKEGGMDVLTAPRQLVIRLEDTTKGVQRGERVLAVFPDTTSFYLGVVHRVPKSAVGSERRIEVKFKDDADDNGRTPARPLPARYVVPLPDGYEEGESKAEEIEGAAGAGAASGGGVTESGGAGEGGRGGRGEEEADDPMVTEEEDGEGAPYADMIRTALMKLPGRQGSLPLVCNYIEEHFHDRLNWKSESSLRRTPAWKSSVRRILAHHPSFCHAGTPERNVYTLAE